MKLIIRKIVFHFFLFSSLSLFLACTSSEKKISEKSNFSKISQTKSGASRGNIQRFYPAGESESILDENGKEVSITEEDFEGFQKPSKDPTEMFRVLITGKKYLLRQIRSTSLFQRKLDPGGDALIVEDVAKYDGQINFLDDGMVVVNLNAKTGKIEKVNFGTRTTRIGNLSKIIQNDSTRWHLEHKTPEPSVTKYTVIYYIQLQGNASKDEIKEQLKKEVRK